MDKRELHQLQAHLRNCFGAAALKVLPSSKDADEANVQYGERTIGKIVVDDEDGDRSFSFEMKIPVERPVLQDYLRRLFENDKLTIMARLKKTDSVELNNGSEFLGVISADDAKAQTFTLQMASLDIDLEDL
jgi:hypothetical protein